MRVLRRIDREQFRMDVQTLRCNGYGDEIHALGGRVFLAPHFRRLWSYARNLSYVLREHGPYDIIHAHAHYHTGHVLRVAQRAGVPVRIVHSRNITPPLIMGFGLLRRAYYMLMARWIARYATVGLAISRKAAMTLFGPAWETDPRWQIFPTGTDLTPFQTPVNSAAVRAELGIPADAFVIGHVGRFHKQKNHRFLVDIAAEIAKREPKVRLLLVGDGPLRPAIKHRVDQAGLADKVIFAGVRLDVPGLMLGAMDVFLFPSFYEGLGVALVEAQAAALPCVFSDVVPEEADLVQPLLRRLSLSLPPSAWAEVVLAAREASPGITQAAGLRLVEQSRLNIEVGVRNLEHLYLEHHRHSYAESN
jgi:glycosyltransferase involved in cell wall biosynthesis